MWRRDPRWFRAPLLAPDGGAGGGGDGGAGGAGAGGGGGAGAGGGDGGGAGGAGGGGGAGGAGGGAGGGGGGNGGAGGGGGGAADETPGWQHQLSPEHRTALKSFNFKTAGDAVGKLLELDKSAGKGIVVPGDDAKPEQLAAFRKALGVPDDEKGYTFKVDDREPDAKLTEWAGKAFLKAGIPAKAATAIVGEWNQFIDKVAADAKADQAAKAAENDGALAKDWGGKAKANTDVAMRAATWLGMKPEQVDAMKTALGSHVAMPLLLRIGNAVAKDGENPGGGNSPLYITTKEEAEVEKKAMFADPKIGEALRDKGHANHKTLNEKLDRLNEIITGVSMK